MIIGILMMIFGAYCITTFGLKITAICIVIGMLIGQFLPTKLVNITLLVIGVILVFFTTHWVFGALFLAIWIVELLFPINECTGCSVCNPAAHKKENEDEKK